MQLNFTLYLIILGPILLGCGCHDGDEIAEKRTRDNMADPIFPAWRELPPHPDEDQVRLDVDRSFVYYPIGMGCSLT